MVYQYGEGWSGKGAGAGAGADSRISGRTTESRLPGAESVEGSGLQGMPEQRGSTGKKFEEILRWWPKRAMMDDEAERQEALLRRLSFQAHGMLGLPTRLSGELHASSGCGPVLCAPDLLCFLC